MSEFTIRGAESGKNNPRVRDSPALLSLHWEGRNWEYSTISRESRKLKPNIVFI
jgi:hypothetical protein